MEANSMARIAEVFDSIPDVDFVAGIRRVSGNAPLYVRLIRMFVADESFQRLQCALTAGDFPSASREAHAIKGAAANLGLMRLSSLADQINASIKRDDVDCIRLLASQLFQARDALQSVASSL